MVSSIYLPVNYLKPSVLTFKNWEEEWKTNVNVMVKLFLKCSHTTGLGRVLGAGLRLPSWGRSACKAAWLLGTWTWGGPQPSPETGAAAGCLVRERTSLQMPSTKSRWFFLWLAWKSKGFGSSSLRRRADSTFKFRGKDPGAHFPGQQSCPAHTRGQWPTVGADEESPPPGS